ncbi:MAG: DsbA family protein [Gammaproteobacteria bacterium]|nr:DsbA family protein [Gammaproteobacteria bacterium]
MSDIVRFYFSFRSPYSWLAVYRINFIIDELPVNFELIPVFPPKDFNNDPRLNKNKLRYMREDISRIAAAYGLTVKRTGLKEPDWIRPHAAYLYAADQGKAMEFCLSAHTARFSEGLDLGDDKVIGDIADQCDLNPVEAVNASNDRKYHHRVMQGMSKANEIRLFGVPFFIYKENKYWGNDRIEWLLRDIYADMNKAVPDLSSAPMLRPF